MIGTNGIRVPSHDHVTEKHVHDLHMKHRMAWNKDHPTQKPALLSVIVPPPRAAARAITEALDLSSVYRDADGDDPDTPVLCGKLNLDLDSFFSAPHGGCRYLIDDGTSNKFCVEVAKEGSSYCDHHHSVCTVPEKRSRDIRLSPAVLDQGYAPIGFRPAPAAEAFALLP